ncbi:MAG: DUF6152 family protein [Caulobacteraceae bacterium]
MKPAPKAAAYVLCSFLALAPAGAALAHHSFAMFDQTRQVTVVGTVKEFQWTNPHAYIEVVDASGTLWSVELNSPNNLLRQGWKRNAMAPGDKVTVIINPLRDGKSGGLFNAVTLPNGTVLGNPKPTGPINVPTP